MGVESHLHVSVIATGYIDWIIARRAGVNPKEKQLRSGKRQKEYLIFINLLAGARY